MLTVGFDTVAGEARYAVRRDDTGTIGSVVFSPLRRRADGTETVLPAGMPVANARLTSRHGYRIHPVTGRGSRHAGVDLAVASGTPVIATSDGRVAIAGWAGNYGLLVSLVHDGGIETRYGHLSSLTVRPGQIVRRGELIGMSGATGRTTGPHVHYEVRVDGQSVDPLQHAS